MNKHYNLLSNLSLFLGIIVVSFACSPINVISNELDTEASTDKYKTYNFYDLKVKAEHPEEVQQDRFEMLKSAVENELQAIGLTKSNDPDIWVNIGVTVEDKVQTRETDIRDAPVYMGQRNYHWESQEVVVGEYKEGTVTIDLIDAETEEMVGQSVASSVIVDKDEKLKKRIDQGMARVFDDLWASKKY